MNTMCASPKLIEQRINAIKSAVALTQDEASSNRSRCSSQRSSSNCAPRMHAIESFDREIAECAPAHPDFSIFDSFPAAGPVFAPRLLTAFGEQRERFPMPDDLQRYGGVAPVTERSGNSTGCTGAGSCPNFLRQTFVEWAALTIPRSFWAAAFYRKQRSAGKTTKPPCVRSPTNGSASFIAAGRHGRPTTKRLYLRSLRQRGSSLLNFMAAEANAVTALDRLTEHLRACVRLSWAVLHGPL